MTSSKSFNLYAQYTRLLRRFGPQEWWPMYRESGIKNLPSRGSLSVLWRRSALGGESGARTIVRRSYPKRLTEADRFQICVGAILTQNTAWANVERAFASLVRAAEGSTCKSFSPPPDGRGSDLSREALAKWERERGRAPWLPTWIASLRRDRLAQLIRPAGYFNQKAKELQIFSRWLLHEYGGSLSQFFRLSTDDCRLQLLSLWGIGPETADSILLYAGQHPMFVIDAYTKRWLEVANTGCWPLRTYDEYQRFFMDRLPHDAALFNEFHALIVAWGKVRKIAKS